MPTAVLQIRKEPHYRRAAFESGLKRLGYTITDKVIHPASKADLLITWNIKNEAETTLFEQRGGTVIVAENGYLQKVDKTYYALSVHGHNVRVEVVAHRRREHRGAWAARHRVAEDGQPAELGREDGHAVAAQGRQERGSVPPPGRQEQAAT
jgi:hypothetical protein